MAITLEEIQKNNSMTDEQIVELLSSMTEEEAMQFLEQEEVKYPMTENEIISKTGHLGNLVLTFVRENYKKQYSLMMVTEEMLPFVQKRVDEARELRNQIETKELEKMNINSVKDTMENIRLRNQARQIADEIIQEEVLFRPLFQDL